MTDPITQLSREKHDQELLFAACVLCSPDIALQESLWLSPLVFTDDKLQKFWDEVRNGSDPVNSANNHGLTTELAGWMNRVPNVTKPDVYARKIAEYKYSLDVLSGNKEVVKAILNKDIGKARSILNTLAETDIDNPIIGKSAVDMGNRLVQMLDAGESHYVKTHISAIDNISGMYGGDLIVIAARPGMGKTALVFVIGRNVAFSGKKVFFFSLEMVAEQLWGRAVSGYAGFDWRDVRKNNIDDAGKQKVKDFSSKFQRRLGSNFVVFDDVFTTGEIIQACLRGKPDLVIIDHLGEIDWDDPNEREVTWFGKACKQLRTGIAKKLMIPLVLVHQLSREVEERKPPIPILKDLRWSGEIEQRSDVVWMGFREDVYLKEQVQADIVPFELWGRKDRQGFINSRMDLNYNLKKQDFTSAGVNT